MPAETCDSGSQTDITMGDMDALLDSKKKMDNPDQLLKTLFVDKVTRNDKSVKRYTGLPSKDILTGAFGKYLLN